MPKSRYPAWIPYPTSWLNAVLLAGLTIGTSMFLILPLFIGMGFAVSVGSNSGVFLLGMLSLVSPIPFIAFVHHFIHLIISRCWPSIQAPEIGKVSGILPGLMSWWEGLFSWLVISLATFMSIVAIVLMSPILYGSVYTIDFYNTPTPHERITQIAGATWLITAAYLYQVSYLVEQRLILVGEQKCKKK